MSQFNKFKQRFEEVFQDEGIYEFIYSPEKFGYISECIHDGDVMAYDSYGSEDSTLFRVYKFPEFNDILVGFYGTRQSYSGEEWNEYKEVKQQTKTIQVYE